MKHFSPAIDENTYVSSICREIYALRYDGKFTADWKKVTCESCLLHRGDWEREQKKKKAMQDYYNGVTNELEDDQ